MSRIINIDSIVGGFKITETINGTIVGDVREHSCSINPSIRQTGEKCPSGADLFAVYDGENKRISYDEEAVNWFIDGVQATDDENLIELITGIDCFAGSSVVTVGGTVNAEITNFDELCECLDEDDNLFCIELGQRVTGTPGGSFILAFPFTVQTNDAELDYNGTTYTIGAVGTTFNTITDLYNAIVTAVGTDLVVTLDGTTLCFDGELSRFYLGEFVAGLNTIVLDYRIGKSDGKRLANIEQILQENQNIMLLSSLLSSIDATLVTLDGNHTDIIDDLNDIKAEIIANGVISANQLTELQSIVSELTDLGVDVSALLTTTNNIYTSDLLRNDYLACIEDGLINQKTIFPDYGSPTTLVGSPTYFTTFPITNPIGNKFVISGSILVNGLTKGFFDFMQLAEGATLDSLDDIVDELNFALENDVDTQGQGIRFINDNGTINTVSNTTNVQGFTYSIRNSDTTEQIIYNWVSNTKISAIDTTNIILEDIKQNDNNAKQDNQTHFITSDTDLQTLAGSTEIISYSYIVFGSGASVQGATVYNGVGGSETATNNNILLNNVSFVAPTSANGLGEQGILIKLKTK